MFHFIGFIVFGFVIGLIARAIVRSHDPMSFAATTILGIAGALIGGWTGRALGWYGPNDVAGFLLSTAGAIVMIAIYHFATRKRAVSTKLSDREFPRRAA